MARKNIPTQWDRDNRNAMNDNFIELYDTATGIKRTIDDLILESGGDSSAEVVHARGGKPTLNSRLDSFESKTTQKLADKIDKGNLSVNDINKNRGKIDQTYLTSELKDQIAGTAGVNVEPANRSVTNAKLTNKSVVPDTTSFIQESTNLFNVDDIVSGVINPSNGELEPQENYVSTPFIPANGNETYTVTNLNRMFYYGADFEFLGKDEKTTYPATHETHADTFYIRLSTNSIGIAEDAQLNKGSTLLPYEPYYLEIPDMKISEDMIPDKKVSNDMLEDGAVTKNKTNFIYVSSNLFLDTEILEGFNINSSGELVEDESYTTSKFIELQPDTTYTAMNVLKVGRYDTNKDYLGAPGSSGETPITFKTHSAIYNRVTFRIGQENLVQLNVGDTVLDYERGGYFLDGDINVRGAVVNNEGNNGEVDDTFNPWEEDRFIVDGDLTTKYTAETVSLINRDIDSDGFIAMYDALMTEFPDYISKVKIKKDSLEKGIYRYDFIPPEVPRSYHENSMYKTKYPKMILVSGVHGSERFGSWNLYNSMREIAENWRSSPNLETLRWNVHFIIIPIVNNYGFDEKTRQNENQIDLARNFPEKFEENDAELGDQAYGGESPLSEAGSQAVAETLEDNLDAIYFGSHHNFAVGAMNDFIWVACATKLQIRLGKLLVSKMTQKWKKEYEWLPQEDDFYVGISDDKAPIGSEGMYASSLGIQGSTFETNSTMTFEETPERDNETAHRLGVEVFINWLVINLRENIKYYNKK